MDSEDEREERLARARAKRQVRRSCMLLLTLQSMHRDLSMDLHCGILHCCWHVRKSLPCQLWLSMGTACARSAWPPRWRRAAAMICARPSAASWATSTQVRS